MPDQSRSHQTPSNLARLLQRRALRSVRQPQPSLPPSLVTTPYNPQAKRNSAILIGGFALLIVLGTLLLRLPFVGATRSLTWNEAYRANHAA